MSRAEVSGFTDKKRIKESRNKTHKTGHFKVNSLVRWE
jgi:hypothetical protein